MESPEELFRQREWIARLAHGLLVDPALADDLTQEAWLLLDKKKELDVGSPREWARAVLRNLHRSGRRSEARRRAREFASARPEAVTSTDELAQRAELQQLLAQEVLALPEPMRATLLQHFFDGLSSSEIARQRDVPAATVRSQLARGLAQLRGRLDEKGGRETWAPALIGLSQTLQPTWINPAPVDSSPGPLTPASAPLLSGILAMKAALLVGILLVLTATASVAWLWNGGDEDSTLAPVAAAAEPNVSESVVIESSGAANSEASLPSTARVALGAATADDPEALASETESNNGGRIHLRAVDAAGVALSGVRVGFEPRDDAQEEGADANLAPRTTDADGLVVLERSGSEASAMVRLAARHPQYSTTWIEATWLAGEEVHLGDLVLLATATLSGRVVDKMGQPLAGVEVSASDPLMEGFDLEVARRHGPDFPFPLPITGTDDAGRFRLEGVAIGLRRLWAGAESFAWTWTEPIELTRGEEINAGELVLHLLRSDDSIGGVVLDPEGNPVGNVSISTMFLFANYGQSGSTNSDEDGHFEFVVEQRAPHDLSVVDPKGRWAQISLHGVEPGETNLVLRFQEAHPIVLRMEDEYGVPVEKARVSARSAKGADSLSRIAGNSHPDGEATLVAPNEEFCIIIKAHGFAPYTGPALDPETVEDELSIRLEHLPGISGRVLLPDGSPASGADVFLREVTTASDVVHVSGYRTFVGPDHADQTKTDGDGYFLLFPEHSRSYLVRAETPGYAPTVTATLAVDISQSVDNLVVKLVRGGVIEGHVLTPPGVDPTGTVLGLNRGDGFARTLRVGPDGSYRFEGLTPGPWELVPREEELDRTTRTVSYTYDSDRGPFDGWTCNVVDGRTTVYDVEIGGFAAVHLAGKLNLEGASVTGWTAQLTDIEFTRVGTPVTASNALSGDGTFLLEAKRPGLYQLVLLAPEGANGQLRLEETLHLGTGETAWNLALTPGRIEGQGAPVTQGSEEPIILWWTPELPNRELQGRIRILPDAAGHFVLGVVPDGALEFQAFDPNKELGSRSSHEVILRLDLAPGATEAVQLDQ